METCNSLVFYSAHCSLFHLSCMTSSYDAGSGVSNELMNMPLCTSFPPLLWPVRSYLFLHWMRSSSLVTSPSRQDNIFFNDIFTFTAKHQAENSLSYRGIDWNPMWAIHRPHPAHVLVQSKSQRSDLFSVSRVNFDHRFLSLA